MNTDLKRTPSCKAVLALIFALLLAGCGGGPIVDSGVVLHLEDKPKELQGLYYRVISEGKKNRVLNFMRVGLAAMELGYNDLAEEAFDDALLTIEAVYGNNPEAAAARGTFSPEDRKTFRGEPYERAMAFYYRGILYLMEEDYENARASFKSGALQDTLAEQKEYRGDFALLDFLEGWSSQCNGDTALASDAYGMAQENNSTITTIPDSEDNLLLLADFGYAPVKVASGEHNHLLKIKKNDSSFSQDGRFRLNGEAKSLSNQESILRQATTRGGREFDVILEGKAQFKEDMESLSETAAGVAQAGAVIGTTGALMDDDSMTQLGSGMAVIGGLASLFSGMAAEATRPEADTRQWDNLPEKVLYGTYRVEGVPVITNLPGTLHLGGGDHCQVTWVRAPATDLPAIR